MTDSHVESDLQCNFNVQREICCHNWGEITIIKWTSAHADRISLQFPFGRRGRGGFRYSAFFQAVFR